MVWLLSCGGVALVGVYLDVLSLTRRACPHTTQLDPRPCLTTRALSLVCLRRGTYLGLRRCRRAGWTGYCLNCLVLWVMEILWQSLGSATVIIALILTNERYAEGLQPISGLRPCAACTPVQEDSCLLIILQGSRERRLGYGFARSVASCS